MSLVVGFALYFVGSVRKRSHGLGLAFETPQRLGIVSGTLGQDLDGNLTVQPRVAGSVHLDHAARADGQDDLIWAESSSNGERHKGTSLVILIQRIIQAALLQEAASACVSRAGDPSFLVQESTRTSRKRI